MLWTGSRRQVATDPLSASSVWVSSGLLSCGSCGLLSMMVVLGLTNQGSFPVAPGFVLGLSGLGETLYRRGRKP